MSANEGLELALFRDMNAGAPPLGTYELKDRGLTGVQMLADFANGYGASVINGPYSYGGDAGLYELAVLHGEKLCYSTPITNDVVGWQSPAEVVELLHQIALLPENPLCTHNHRRDEED